MTTNPSRIDEASRKHVDPMVADLVNRARSGERQAWDALVERYAPLIWSICRRYQLDAADAQDAAQSIWLKLMDHLGSLRDPAALPGWLATTTWRECGRILRATRRPCNAGYAPDAGPTPTDRARAAEHDLLAAERYGALREAFGQLPPGCQQLITLLIHNPALSCAEIGARLGIPVGSIGPSRRCCLDKLRRHPAIVALINADAQTATSAAHPPPNAERSSRPSRAFPASPAIPTWATRQTANAPLEICEPSRACTQNEAGTNSREGSVNLTV
jgi:RNA polymerase sigma factor (sigma-70 family)